MTNILQIQQDVAELHSRVTREIQFGADTERELLKTVDLMGETLDHLRDQISRLFKDRRTALEAAVGTPTNVEAIEQRKSTNGTGGPFVEM